MCVHGPCPSSISKRGDINMKRPEFLPGETWYPRGQGLARTIVRREAVAGGQELIYRTSHGEFAAKERDFQFWIERLSASPPR
jgi:hypothetical protein